MTTLRVSRSGMLCVEKIRLGLGDRMTQTGHGKTSAQTYWLVIPHADGHALLGMVTHRGRRGNSIASVRQAAVNDLLKIVF